MARKVVRRLVQLNQVTLARFVVVAKAFMLRVASEAAPLQVNGRRGLSEGDARWHSALKVERDGKVVSIEFRRRKNRPAGDEVVRRCSCRQSPDILCGPCAIVGQMREAAPGRGDGRLFNLDLRQALLTMRSVCSEVGAPHFSWHCLRRGTAQDLAAAGTDLGQILTAGGWSSSAVLRYVSSKDVDSRVLVDMHLEASDSE